jgi:hypothetical protein
MTTGSTALWAQRGSSPCGAIGPAANAPTSIHTLRKKPMALLNLVRPIARDRTVGQKRAENDPGRSRCDGCRQPSFFSLIIVLDGASRGLIDEKKCSNSGQCGNCRFVGYGCVASILTDRGSLYDGGSCEDASRCARFNRWGWPSRPCHWLWRLLADEVPPAQSLIVESERATPHQAALDGGLSCPTLLTRHDHFETAR